MASVRTSPACPPRSRSYWNSSVYRVVASNVWAIMKSAYSSRTSSSFAMWANVDRKHVCVERIHTTEEQAETAAQRSFVLDTPHPRNWHRIINYIGIIHFSVAQNCNVIHRTKLFAVTPRGNYFELIKGNFLFSSSLEFPLTGISDIRSSTLFGLPRERFIQMWTT